jgi:iron complex outermembrane receptor protein
MTSYLKTPLGVKKPLAVALVMAWGAPTVNAQESGSSLSDLLLEEIVVTAQKREENIQDVPVAVTSLSSELLEAQGINTPGDLSRIVPNMAMADYQGEVRIAIRGVGQLVQQANPGIAIHTDGVYQPRASMAGLLQLDMAGVEVLRGPQGTVYGRNANGGAINYTSKSAGEEFAGEVKVGYADYDETTLQLGLDMPISDTVGARLSLRHWERGEGLIENVGSGRDGHEGEISSARLRIDADFSDTVSGNFIVNYLDSDGSFSALSSTPIGSASGYIADPRLGTSPLSGLNPNAAATPLNDASLGFHQISQNTDSEQVREYLSVAATFDWDINDILSLKSITAFQSFEDLNTLDVDSSNAGIVFSTVDQEADTFTQEFNLNFTTDRIQGVVGAFYMDDELSGSNFLPFTSDPADAVNVPFGPTVIGQSAGFFPNSPPIPLGGYSEAYWEPLATESTAVFADVTFNLNDYLDLIAGVRYSRDELTLDQLGGFSGPAGSVPGVDTGGRRVYFPPDEPNNACNFDPSEIGVVPGAAYNRYENTTNTTTPKIGLNYTINDDSSVYATYSEGFKAGGVSVRSGCENIFDEETVKAFEVGTKNTFADGRLRLNATAFYYQYEGYQVEQLVGLTFQLDNIEESEIMGLEIEATAVLTDQLSLIANASFQDSEIEEHTATDGITYNGGPNPALGAPGPLFFTATPQLNTLNEDVSGNPLPNAPETTLNLSMNYDFNDNFSLQVGAAYTSDINFREFDREADGQDAYTLWNANLSWTNDEGNINIRLWGENLSDEEYFLFKAANQLTDNRLGSVGAPRRIGAELTYLF